jgi:hypothetical protein
MDEGNLLVKEMIEELMTRVKVDSSQVKEMVQAAVKGEAAKRTSEFGHTY